MNRNYRISRISKMASKAGSKAAKGMNFILNQQGKDSASCGMKKEAFKVRYLSSLI